MIADTDATPRRKSGPGPWINDPFAETFRAWRVSSELSQQAVAEILGITQAEVSQWERGWIQAPRYQRMSAVAEMMGLELTELLRQTRWVGPRRELEDRANSLLVVSAEPMADLLAIVEGMRVDDIALLVRIARVLAAT